VSSLRCLDRRFRPMAEHLLHIARKYGPYRVTSACRSEKEQERLYQAYLAGQNEFPVAPPGHSAHQRGLAVDISRPDIDPYQDLFLQLLGSAWRGSDPSLVWSESDPIHFEFRPN
jgi:LAS superfamily LD-carboxypeptidase LdcB